MSEHAKKQGWFDLVEILSTAHPEVIAGFLGVLARGNWYRSVVGFPLD